jgi:U3 small nucleolar ribonucleoprotein protein IMP3
MVVLRGWTLIHRRRRVSGPCGCAMRKLKYHESKLLKKVDFLNWKQDNNLREVKILRRYHVQDREDYHTYNKVVGLITKLTTMLKGMDASDPVRIELTEQLVDKLYGLGMISNKRLLACDQIAASTLCRRRLPVVLVRLKFAETMKEAVSLVEQGHIRVGPHAITDPSFLVSRTMEDYVTWVDTSRIKRTIMKYNDRLDDFDLL